MLRFVPRGWVRDWQVGEGLRLLEYEDPAAAGGRTLRIEHVCKTMDGDQMLLAPALDDHELVSLDPPHLEPSILCPDCGLHGFIREGRWVAA